ncbi:FtsB family cell division protein [Psychroserpens luteolus]|uniref:FtsB family cell division protein n=1 Tax=Psychroserpens luteolus TaxID=2855840 RepID=UPI001E39D5C5|nr:septum formation initiator family protein [Psychroserpens luteolus]MCD2258765.1 septum formation initiator family protein [Psychroserpens luteolus]
MLKYLKNIYAVVFIVFAIWMLFIDSNSLIIHRELNKDMNDLNDEKEYYKSGIEKDNKAIKELSTEEGVEKLAREKYYMKKENEDIYIIEYEDSLKLEKNDE